MPTRKQLLIYAFLVPLLLHHGEQTARSQNEPKISLDTQPLQVETIAVLPWNMENGTEGAKKTTREFISALMTKIKVEEIREVRTMTAWDDVNRTESDDPTKAFPTPAQMLRTGVKLKTDWVMAGKISWHSRSIWVGLGPKTKSTCTLSVRIVDVNKQTVALDVKDMKMDSTAKEDTLKALGSLFVSGLFTFVSGGPKTPHEQRAAQIGIAKAMEPWLAQHLKNIRIEPDQKIKQ